MKCKVYLCMKKVDGWQGSFARCNEYGKARPKKPARSNRSSAKSCSFYLMGLLWCGDLEKHVWVSFFFWLKWKHWLWATCLAMLHAAHSLDRDDTHLWSNIESKVQNELKRRIFCTFWYKSAQFLSIPQRNHHTLSAKLKKLSVFAYLPRAVQIEAIPNPVASIWFDCFEVETLEKHPNCKTLSRFGLLCLCPERQTLVCSTCPAMLHTVQFRGKSSKRVDISCFLHILSQKCTNLVNLLKNL